MGEKLKQLDLTTGADLYRSIWNERKQMGYEDEMWLEDVLDGLSKQRVNDYAGRTLYKDPYGRSSDAVGRLYSLCEVMSNIFYHTDREKSDRYSEIIQMINALDDDPDEYARWNDYLKSIGV